MASCSAIDCSLPLIILLWLTHGLPKHVYSNSMDCFVWLSLGCRGISTNKIKHSWIMDRKPIAAVQISFNNCKSLENKGGEPFFNNVTIIDKMSYLKDISVYPPM